MSDTHDTSKYSISITEKEFDDCKSDADCLSLLRKKYRRLKDAICFSEKDGVLVDKDVWKDA